MRGSTPTLHCDAEDGLCGSWDIDYYDAGVSSVSGVRITAQRRAPGWVGTDDRDLCPEHSGEVAS